MSEARCWIYRHGARRGVGVALTFDDGPNPPRTEQILSRLAEPVEWTHPRTTAANRMVGPALKEPSP